MSNFTCPLPSECTIQTCPLTCAQIEYLPSVGGNATYATLFGLLLIAQMALGIKYKVWGFMTGMIFGLVLEVIGYAGRVMLHNNPFDFNSFLVYLIPLTIGPAFLAASIYLCLARIIVVYGTNLARFKPRTYAIVFMCSDFISLLLQAVGGAIASTAGDHAGSQTGVNTMIAGLSWQVVSLFIYLAAWADFVFGLWTARKSGGDSRFKAHEVPDRRFKAFQYALLLATILILVRSIYRVAELQGGFTGAIANNEAAFMVLEGLMIILAVFVLTVLHPGYAFGGSWHTASWSMRGRERGSSMNHSGHVLETSSHGKSGGV